MRLEAWIQQELADVVARLNTQVLALVPREHRQQRPGGGNSINWATFHISRHAELALAVLTSGAVSHRGALGLGEVEQEWPDDLGANAIEQYAGDVFARARRFALMLDAGSLDRIPDAATTLERAAVPRAGYDWLYEQWTGRPASFFIRWPVIAHATNHIGEMIATRNRLGLSPYSS